MDDGLLRDFSVHLWNMMVCASDDYSSEDRINLKIAEFQASLKKLLEGVVRLSPGEK